MGINPWNIGHLPQNPEGLGQAGHVTLAPALQIREKRVGKLIHTCFVPRTYAAFAQRCFRVWSILGYPEPLKTRAKQAESAQALFQRRHGLLGGAKDFLRRPEMGYVLAKRGAHCTLAPLVSSHQVMRIAKDVGS